MQLNAINYIIHIPIFSKNGLLNILIQKNSILFKHVFKITLLQNTQDTAIKYFKIKTIN